MAVRQLTVTPATQQQFNELDAAVGQSMTMHGPPDGLMSHVVYQRRGFVVTESAYGVRRQHTWMTSCARWSAT